MVAKESNLRMVLAALLLGILMAAMDNTIVATAMGRIVYDLNGLDKFVWVTSAYMVAVMAGMPIFGKLSDMYGRKRFFIFGLTIFLLGSILCGLSQTIEQLIVFRALQGIGGGALMPIAFTIIFDVFPPEQRGKMTGILGAVFGSASVAGPLLGAYLTDSFSWHMVFFVNVPIGIISLFLITRYYKESLNHKEQKIDWIGAFTIVGAVVSLMFAIELGGKEYAWDSVQIISLFSAFAILFVAFLFAETRASDPIISFWMFKSKLFSATQVVAFIYGATFVGLTVFIPIFIQAVYGGSATQAGLVLMPMMLGSVVGSGFAGVYQTKMSYRNLMLISVVSFAIGMYLLSTLSADSARILITLFMTIAGFGVGFSFSLLPSATVHNLEPQYRGSANSTNAFFRSLGMTVGISIMGTIQSKALTTNLEEGFAGAPQGNMMNFGNLRTIFEDDQRKMIPEPILNTIIDAMTSSITLIFTVSFFIILVAVFFIFLMGNARLEVKKKEDENLEETAKV